MSLGGFLSKMPVVGNFFPSDEAEAHKANLAGAAASYQAYRPEMAQAYTNALGNTLGAYSGIDNYIAQKYGAGAVPRPVIANPLSPRAQTIGSVQDATRGGTAGDVAGGAIAGAGVGAMTGATAGMGALSAPGAVVGGAVGGILGAAGAAMHRGTVAPAPIGAFKQYQTYPSRTR